MRLITRDVRILITKNHGGDLIGAIIGALLLAVSAFPGVVLAEIESSNKLTQGCVPVASWWIPGKEKISGNEIISRLANKSVVLLGEMHDNSEHHRWQLQMLAALYAVRPNMVIGFEMFPRRVQKVLDRWVIGELSVTEFLTAVDWKNSWGIDENLYLPLFHFARMNRVPMLALNIDMQLRKKIHANGFDNVPENEREGLTNPAAPSDAYLNYLRPIYEEHEHKEKKQQEISNNNLDFERFVRGQQLWDRAMAEALYSALDRPGKPLLVGIMGSGHIKYGYGVPHQLRDLDVTDVAMLLPWDSAKSCEGLVAGFADAVFGIASSFGTTDSKSHSQLGIRFEVIDNGFYILQVEKNSIAEKAGIQDHDTIIEIAGLAVKKTNDIVEIVRRQAPGTWLPLKVKRKNEIVVIIAKFPTIIK